jgi:AP-1-like factor
MFPPLLFDSKQTRVSYGAKTHISSQRAFRERKERHVRDLEQKLNELEQASNSLHADNERLKQQLAKVATENEILRATSQSRVGAPPGGQRDGEQEPSATTAPMRFSPTDFYDSVLSGHGDIHRNPVHRVVVNKETGERLLDAGATWDYIQHHELFKRGLVDIAAVSDRLKPHAQCDGQGPVFEEGRIRKILEESVAAGSDELI